MYIRGWIGSKLHALGLRHWPNFGTLVFINPFNRASLCRHGCSSTFVDDSFIHRFGTPWYINKSSSIPRNFHLTQLFRFFLFFFFFDNHFPRLYLNIMFKKFQNRKFRNLQSSKLMGRFEEKFPNVEISKLDEVPTIRNLGNIWTFKFHGYKIAIWTGL